MIFSFSTRSCFLRRLHCFLDTRTFFASLVSYLALALTQDNTGTLALTAQALPSPWGNWQSPYMMDTSAYDQQAVTSAAMPRSFMSPSHNMSVSYTTTCTSDMVNRQAQPQQSLYNYSYNPAADDDLSTMDYVQRRPQPQTLDSPTGHLSTSYSPSPRQSFGSDHESEDYTYVKPEPRLATTSPSWNHTYPSQFLNTTTSPNSVIDFNFGTDVDTLMRAIQSKLHPESSDTPRAPPIKAIRPAVQQSRNIKYPQYGHDKEKLHEDHHRKRHECHVGACRKAFVQKTHLEIHIRAHTGVKPYVSTHPPLTSPAPP